MPAYAAETVLSVRHWNDTLFSFTTTRDPGFRFKAGQCVLIGLEVDGKPLLRAYSMVSAPWEEQLEFYSIKVPKGPLTSRLQNIRPGDALLVGRQLTGVSGEVKSRVAPGISHSRLKPLLREATTPVVFAGAAAAGGA